MTICSVAIVSVTSWTFLICHTQAERNLVHTYVGFCDFGSLLLLLCMRRESEVKVEMLNSRLWRNLSEPA